MLKSISKTQNAKTFRKLELPGVQNLKKNFRDTESKLKTCKPLIRSLMRYTSNLGIQFIPLSTERIFL